LQIIECIGFELEKEKPNTPEDFFNRSEITFLDEGKEKTLHILYVRYFDQIFQEFTPYHQDPIFGVGESSVYFKDIVALVCLLKDPKLRSQKRLYINSKDEFASYFEGINFNKIQEIFQTLKQKKRVELHSPNEFFVQPS
jgi:hypothetical protein